MNKMKHIQREMDAQSAIIVDDDENIENDSVLDLLVKNGNNTLPEQSLRHLTFESPVCGQFTSDKGNNYRALEMCEGVTTPSLNLCKFYSHVNRDLIYEPGHHTTSEDVKPPKKTKITPLFLKKNFFEDLNIMEIGVDEAGRGPLFGRVYTAAVILPKDPDLFDHTLMKDSKKFHSKKKIEAVAEYIKEKAIAWSVTYEDEKSIDDINILQATQKSMHHSITNVIEKQTHPKSVSLPGQSFYLLIDGNYFNPLTIYNKNVKKIEVIPHICIEGGDNQYASIAAASILAKVERDQYIENLCKEHPDLGEKYGIDTNKGYGAKKHLEGIQQYGITEWHRKTFGICKNFA